MDILLIPGTIFQCFQMLQQQGNSMAIVDQLINFESIVNGAA